MSGPLPRFWRAERPPTSPAASITSTAATTSSADAAAHTPEAVSSSKPIAKRPPYASSDYRRLCPRATLRSDESSEGILKNDGLAYWGTGHFRCAAGCGRRSVRAGSQGGARNGALHHARRRWDREAQI